MSKQRPGLDFALGSPGSSRGISLAIFYALRDRPAFDLRFLLRECERVLDEAGWCAAERSDAQTLAVDALRAFADAHEQRLPTTKQYAAWRKSPSAPGGLPSEPAIRRAFGGSWKLALRAVAGGEEVNVVAARQIRAAGSAYTPDELMAAVRDFVADERVTVARWKEYRRWAGNVLAVDPERRVPSSRHSFRKLGGFRAVCELVGVASVVVGLSREHRHYGHFERVAVLVRAWEECGRPSRLTTTQYVERRLVWQRTALERGESAAFPSVKTLVDAYNGWAGALLAARLIDAEEHRRITQRQRTKRIDSETGLKFLMEALEANGPTLGPTMYEAWADGHPGNANGAGPPSRGWFVSRFGSFDDAQEIALRRLRDGRDSDERGASSEGDRS